MVKLKVIIRLLFAKRWYVATEHRTKTKSVGRVCQHIQAQVEQDTFMWMQISTERSAKQQLEADKGFEILWEKMQKS